MKLRVLAERISVRILGKRAPIDIIFSLRQLQEICREQGEPLYVAFIDLTKAFDLVSRDGLFKILAKIGCPPTLLSIVRSFHDNMKGTVLYNGATSDPFNILSGVKQSCVLAHTWFGIFFATLLNMLLENQQKVSTSKPDQMGICLNSLDSEPKPECMRNTFVTSYL